MLVLNLTALLFTLSPFIATQVQDSQVQLIAQKKPVLLLFYSSQCPYCHDVLNYLNKIHKQVPMKDVVTNHQAYEELANLGQVMVPCLLIDGKPIYDSTAVIQWLSQHQDLLDPS
jgi:glutaredoxin 3